MPSINNVKAFKKTISVLNTAEQLTTETTAKLGRFATNVVLHTPSSNSATVYIGDSTVDSAAGFPLVAGSTLALGDVLSKGTGREFDMSAIYVYGAATNVVHVIHEVEV